jgi:hypothetical protein
MMFLTAKTGLAIGLYSRKANYMKVVEPAMDTKEKRTIAEQKIQRGIYSEPFRQLYLHYSPVKGA